MRWGVLLLALLLVVSLTPLAVYAVESKPVVVATTSVLASIVKDLAGDKVVVEVVASPALCPAHYDVKPSDVEKFKHASLILYHGFEPWVKDLAEASGTKAPLVRVSGPWNTPDKLKRLYEKVAEALEKHLGLDVRASLERCLKAIDDTAKWLRDFASKNSFVGTPVVVMLWQKPFISYLGFKIVAVFRPPERVTPAELHEVISNATREGAVLVIDNLQSGTDLGEKIAREIGAVEVALTNFPWIAPGVNNVTEMMKYNAKLLAKALKLAGLAGKGEEVSRLRQELVALRNEASLWKYSFVASLVLNILLLTTTLILYRRVKGR